jgi:hypothetical protein
MNPENRENLFCSGLLLQKESIRCRARRRAQQSSKLASDAKAWLACAQDLHALCLSGSFINGWHFVSHGVFQYLQFFVVG